jgi:hypothetical protein
MLFHKFHNRILIRRVNLCISLAISDFLKTWANKSCAHRLKVVNCLLTNCEIDG